MKKQASKKNDYKGSKDKAKYSKLGKKDMKIIKGAGIRPAVMQCTKPK
jgi:hypothetical protein